MGLLDTIKEAIGMSDGAEDFDSNENYVTDQPTYDNDEEIKRNRVVKIHATAQSKEIANHLNSKKTVVLNLESTTPDVTRRIIDFLGGVAYANGGNIKPVANNTFIITPYNVGFVGEDLVGELENNGVFL